MSKGTDLWDEAKQKIPGGNQLLSKRSEMFLPNIWPSYFDRAKGVNVWDLDNKKYRDFSIMGVGACILGYADDRVNEEVVKSVMRGNMTTLNCPEEVFLTRKLLEIHPWAGMVRYAKTGGEAMAVAVRIARAFSGKDKIAFCGYHGWHDWYLSSNLSDNKNLDGHLLPGLEPRGVPRYLKGTAIPFEYNRADQLRKIVSENDIGVIVMEPIRYSEPDDGFLNEVRRIADEIGSVLIFDEITSGWRVNYGGAYMKYGITPDIVVYGKALGNGYAISSVVGKKDVMNAAQESFISSTFWTDRIGYVAAIKTLEILEKEKVWEHLCFIGNKISDGWKRLADKHGLVVKVKGIAPLTTLNIVSEKSQVMHTLFTQEMLERGYLASKSVYVCQAHTDEMVCEYLRAVDEVFGVLKKAENNPEAYLKSDIAHSGFKRLT